MNNNKISDFYKKLKQNGSINSSLKEKIQCIKNEDDLRKVIEDEIIPLGRKLGVNFTPDELIDYEMQVNKTLSDTDLEYISGGISNKGLLFSGLASLMFLKFGHTMTGSNSHAVNLNQAIHSTQQQIDNIEYSSEVPSKSIEPSILDQPQTATNQIPPVTETIPSDPTNTPTLDQPQLLEGKKPTNPDTLTGTSPRDSQLDQPQLLEGQEPTNPDTPTDTSPRSSQLSIQQIATSTEAILAKNTNPAQILTDTTATPDHTYTALMTQLSNNAKLYCLDALNLCDPYIYDLTKVYENLRLFDGNIKTVTMDTTQQDIYKRIYSLDEGDSGSASLMKILFPSNAGELNFDANHNNKALDAHDPSPEDTAMVISSIFKYRNNDSYTKARLLLLNNWDQFGKSFTSPTQGRCSDMDQFKSFLKTIGMTTNEIPTDVLKSIKDEFPTTLKRQEDRKKYLKLNLLGYNQKNTTPAEMETLKNQTNKFNTLLSILQNAIYMVNHQEKNEPSESESTKIFPKYTPEKLIMGYFIKKFNTDDEIALFYKKVANLLVNEHYETTTPVTKEEIDQSKARLSKLVQTLQKCVQCKYSPYEEQTKNNNRCYRIKTEEIEGTEKIKTISFSPSETFSDCAEITARHIMNLLIYSQGKIDNPDNPWAKVLPKDESTLKPKLEKVINAITSKNREQVEFYSLKERLQIFFLHQKNVGVDAGDTITRALWEYAICKLSDSTNGFDPIIYKKEEGCELYTGYKNMLTLMCRCAQELFPEKDIKSSYEKVKKCPEYDDNGNLTEAIRTVFKLFNQSDPTINTEEKHIIVNFPDLDNLKFSIFQSHNHADATHYPLKIQNLSNTDLNAIKTNGDDLSKMFISFLTNKTNEKIDLHEDFHKLFFGKGVYNVPNRNSEDTLNSGSKPNLDLPENILNNEFFTRYCTLKLLKYAQGEEKNTTLISSLIEKYFQDNSWKDELSEEDLSTKENSSKVNCKLNIKLVEKSKEKKEISLDQFIFNNYSIDPKDFPTIFPWRKKAFEYINKDNEITIPNPSKYYTGNKKFRYTIDNGKAVLYPVEDTDTLYIPCNITVEEKQIPVVGLGKAACYGFDEFKYIEFAEEITNFHIGDGAFYNCRNIQHIRLPDSINDFTIGEKAFFYDENDLSSDFSNSDSYLFDDSMTTTTTTDNIEFTFSERCQLKNLCIKKSAFENSKIESFTIPKTVINLTIEQCAFANCECFNNFTIETESLLQNLYIKSDAFRKTAINRLDIPKSIINLTIGKFAFNGCSSFKEFKIDPESHLKNLHIKNLAFSESPTQLTIPNSIENLTISKVYGTCRPITINQDAQINKICIKQRAFENAITNSVVIPKTTETLIIEQWAFHNAESTAFSIASGSMLKNLYIQKAAFKGTNIQFSVPEGVTNLEIENHAFDLQQTSSTITIPDSITILKLYPDSFTDKHTVRIPKRLEQQLRQLKANFKIEYVS